ncbi:hypothetical protein [Natronobeatus ordinarius]|uniref:hypothetical protein n=1 Tax=Natronobeatus ordinarius TaxID=2963433 RepID=UPI0020CC1E8D|nr:hypothetical protein [Natronobeatus ordinarius]
MGGAVPQRHRVRRRQALRALGVAGFVGVAGCLGGDDGTGTDGADDDDDASGESGGERLGTAEISFLGETYTFDDASCEGSRTFPPENEMIHYRDYGSEFEFWVERYDPDESDVVKVHLGFPSESSQQIGEIEAYTGQTTIDEIEAYTGQTTIDEIEFELDSRTSGSLELEPSSHMNDDVEHEPEGGTVEWKFSC